MSVGRRKTGAANRYPTPYLPSMHLPPLFPLISHRSARNFISPLLRRTSTSAENGGDSENWPVRVEFEIFLAFGTLLAILSRLADVVSRNGDLFSDN